MNKFFLFNTRSQAKNFIKRISKVNPDFIFFMDGDKVLCTITYAVFLGPEGKDYLGSTTVIGRVKKKN